MLEQLQTIIDEQIAPAYHMGLIISDYSGDTLTITAPLAKNTNHHGTAFGGSQYSMAAVAGWALLRCKLAEANLTGTIVVKTATMDYRRPVSSEHYAVRVEPAKPHLLDSAIRTLAETGTADFPVQGVIQQKGKDAALYRGTYCIKKTTN